MIDGPEATDRPESTDEPDEPVKSEQRKFPTAFTVLAIVLLAVWALSFVIPSGTYEVDPKTGGPVPGTYKELPRATTSRRAPLRRQVARRAAAAALDVGPQRPLRDRERPRRRRPVQLGLPLRLGDDLPLRPRGRRVRQRDDEDRGDPDRDRPTGAALQAQRLDARDRPDEHLRARRDDLRHVGGDARLLRPAGSPGAGAQLRPASSRSRSSSSGPAPACSLRP